MTHRRRLDTLLFAASLFILGVLAGCDRPSAATPTAVPTAPQPTTPATASCARGYVLLEDKDLGFTLCYPSGWSVSRDQDQGGSVTRWTLAAPSESGATVLRLANVSVTPVPAGLSEEQALQRVSNWLRQEYFRTLLAGPGVGRVAGQQAVYAGYETVVVLGRQAVPVTRWVTVVWHRGRQWFIEVAGRSEFRAELSAIRSELVASFQFLPDAAAE